ncbi:uncharacterized protein CMU_020700 [Cryptosporidium muris RN66]|uniref:Uncharacterized protein n=1 Tax=Cryptosporidium muris (strain RN66) TaxID=441375 RepID=B6AJ89_CRYMR|nr:uncharacterized protein CMU_020700 [Cryptosporidium muris RN66]EEA08326.1 hypothetical protein, conserved [Cryptosporidium muris RN66]|eukprot:XP_002142675.1 hypothetical protein [Cryptosporidium muris RN66]
MEQLEVVIKNDTTVTFFRRIHILDRGDWVYHPPESIIPGKRIFYACTNTTSQPVKRCIVQYSAIIESIEYVIKYEYESEILGVGEVLLQIGTIGKDDIFIEGSSEIPINLFKYLRADKADSCNSRNLFSLELCNDTQKSSRRIITRATLNETELGSNYIQQLKKDNRFHKINNKKDIKFYHGLNMGNDWYRRLRKCPRSLYIRIVNCTNYSLHLVLSPFKKGSSKNLMKSRTLPSTTLSSAIVPSIHLSDCTDDTISHGPNAPFSLSNLIFGGQWIEFPPEVIESNSFAEFGAGCDSFFSLDFRGIILYRIFGYAGKIKFSWEFPLGLNPHLFCDGFHNLKLFIVSCHYENLNDGKVIFHVIDPENLPLIRIVSAKVIFSENILINSNRSVNNLSDIMKDIPNGSSKFEDINDNMTPKNEIEQKVLLNKASKVSKSLEIDQLYSPMFPPIANLDQFKDITKYILEYTKDQRISLNNDLQAEYYIIDLESPRVLFSFLIASNVINIHSKYPGSVDSLLLLLEWNIGCELFKRVWGPDERVILQSSLIGGIDDSDIILNSTLRKSFQTNKVFQRCFPFNTNIQMNIVSLNIYNQDLLTAKNSFSPLTIALSCQQLLSEIMVPYLMHILKSSNQHTSEKSSIASTSSKLSSSTNAYQPLVESEHFWKYCNVKSSTLKLLATSESNSKSCIGMMDFEGMVNFMLYHWSDTFNAHFTQKLTKFKSTHITIDNIIETLQHVSLLWANKEFDKFENILFVQEFLDIGMIFSEIIEGKDSMTLYSLSKLKMMLNENVM